MKKQKRKQQLDQPKQEQRVLSSQELYQARWLAAEHQLYADLRQISSDMMKMLAMLSTLTQQMQEAAERYRKSREG